MAVLTAIEPHAMLIVLLTLVVLTALPFAVAIDARRAWKVENRGLGSGFRFSLRQLFLAVSCLAVYLSMLRDPWPFRLRFAVSRSALARLATQVERGGSMRDPQWAGLFQIRAVEWRERDGQVYTFLWTRPGGGSPVGFVHPAPANQDWYNDWSTSNLSDKQWQHVI